MRNQVLKFALPTLLFIYLCQTVQAQTIQKANGLLEDVTALQSCTLGNQIFFSCSAKKDESVKVISTKPDLTKHWEQEFKGYLTSFQSLENSLLLIVSTDSDSKGGNNTIKAYIIDPKTGGVQSEKIIFTADDGFLITRKVIVAKNKKTFSLITRNTSAKRVNHTPFFQIFDYPNAKKFSAELNATTSFTVTLFNQKLEAIENLSPKLVPGNFIDAVKGPNNDLFIATAQENAGVTISKYEAGKENASETVTEPFSYTPESEQRQLYEILSFTADSVKNNTVYLTGALGGNKSSVCVFNKYDFASNQHKRFSKTITKEELKGYEKAYKSNNKEFKTLELNHAETVKILKVLESEKGFLVVMSDISFSFGAFKSGNTAYRSNTFTAGGLILCNLDKDLKLKSVSTVPRYSDLVFEPEINAWHKGDSWYLLASSGYYSMCVLAKLNDGTGVLEELKAIKPNKAGQMHFAGLNQAILADSGFVLPLREHKPAIGRIKFDLDVHQFNW